MHGPGQYTISICIYVHSGKEWAPIYVYIHTLTGQNRVRDRNCEGEYYSDIACLAYTRRKMIEVALVQR